MAWRNARSLDTLRAQFNKACPGRSKVSDGTIGDQAHAARTSFHNPDSNGIVRANDFTHDPAHGMDIDRITDQLVASRDPRIHELIANGQYWSKANPRWVKYNGSNPHNKHFHITVVPASAGGDDTRPWALPMFTPLTTTVDRPVAVKETGMPTADEVAAAVWRYGVKNLGGDVVPVSLILSATEGRVSNVQGRLKPLEEQVTAPRQSLVPGAPNTAKFTPAEYVVFADRAANAAERIARESQDSLRELVATLPELVRAAVREELAKKESA